MPVRCLSHLASLANGDPPRRARTGDGGDYVASDSRFETFAQVLFDLPPDLGFVALRTVAAPAFSYVSGSHTSSATSRTTLNPPPSSGRTSPDTAQAASFNHV